MPRANEVYLLLELRVEGAEPARRELLADRLTFEAADLVVWDRGRVEFRCPADSVLSVAFAPDKTLYTVVARRSRGRASTRWTRQDEVRLIQLDRAGESLESMARILERNEGAIRARLTRLRRPSQHSDS